MRAALRQFVIRRLWQKIHSKIARENPYIITVTGTVGKTSAKEALASMLALSGRPVVKTLGNLATEVGVPLSLMGFEEQPTTLELLHAVAIGKGKVLKSSERPYYVLEFSADKAGDIRYITQHISSQVGVITAITPAHMQGYKNFAELVEEKFSLLDGVVPEGYVVLNADDEAIHTHHYVKHPIFWYGISKTTPTKAGVWAHHVRCNEKGLQCSVSFIVEKGKAETIEVQTQLLGEHQLYPVLAAATVAWREQLAVSKIQRAIEQYRMPNGRGVLIAGKRRISIIDDTYNSSPEAVKAGLRMIRSYAGDRHTVAILGSMNELGSFAEEAHREVAKVAAKSVDMFVAVGQYAEMMVDTARKAGMPSMHALSFTTPEHLLGQLEQVVQSDDVVYIKASQNKMRLERVVKALMLKPDQADKLLVRQGNYWKG